MIFYLVFLILFFYIFNFSKFNDLLNYYFIFSAKMKKLEKCYIQREAVDGRRIIQQLGVWMD